MKAEYQPSMIAAAAAAAAQPLPSWQEQFELELYSCRAPPAQVLQVLQQPACFCADEPGCNPRAGVVKVTMSGSQFSCMVCCCCPLLRVDALSGVLLGRTVLAELCTLPSTAAL